MNSKTSIVETSFGRTPSGEQVSLFIISRRDGLKACITNFGGIVTELHTKDQYGNYEDVVLGFDNIETYLEENIYAGAIVGRIAGRLTNGQLRIRNKTYQLPQNEGQNHLHGGIEGLDKKVWEAEIIESNEGQSLKLVLLSPDGEEGYPGNLHVEVEYSLTSKNGLRIYFKATTDQPTPVCLTNHSYFNLAGAGNGNVLDHQIAIDSQAIVEVDQNMIPTGKMLNVASTSNDLRKPVCLGDIVEDIHLSHGANYITEGDGECHKVAELVHPNSGRRMEVWSTTSSIQLYTGRYLNTKKGKAGKNYKKFSGLCLECQGFSDAPNHDTFKSIILNPEEEFTQSVEYRFITAK